MAALSLQERVMALRVGEPTRYRMEGALSKRAKTILREPGQPDNHVALAKAVILAPDAHAYKFGVAALTEPRFDNVENVNDIPDSELVGAVQELWGLFAPDIQPEVEA